MYSIQPGASFLPRLMRIFRVRPEPQEALAALMSHSKVNSLLLIILFQRNPKDNTDELRPADW